MRKILFILLLIPLFAHAQSDDEWTSANERAQQIVLKDSLKRAEETEYKHYISLQKKPDAIRAVWLGALVPGLGQIYNQSYWKLPIVYGGAMGCIYAITWTNGMYSDYKQAYLDITTDVELSADPARSYNAIMPEGYTIERMGGRVNYANTLHSYQNSYRRYRDISIVAAVVLYALTLIDAYVDAQLFDFDVSPDLSMDVAPDIHYDIYNQRSAELKLALHF